MIKVQLAQEKSHFEHRRSNISNSGEDVACAQPSITQEEDEIQNSNFERKSSKRPSDGNDEDDRKLLVKRIKQEPEDKAQSWAWEEQTQEPTPKPWADKKDYQAIFRKSLSIGEDAEDNYDVIDIQIEA